VELPRRCDEDPRTSRQPDRVLVARAEVHGVAARERVPGERVVVPTWAELGPDGRDRPLARVVDVREPAPLRRVHEGSVHDDPAPFQLGLRATSEVAGSEHDEELDGIGELRELRGGDRASARCLFP
jgi:hypothetical protein